MGFERDCCSDSSLVYRIPVSSNGISPIGDPADLNIPFDTRLGWGDMVTSREDGYPFLYMTLDNNYNGFGTYAKYNIWTGAYSVINSTMDDSLQIGVDIDGALWGGSVSDTSIQKINKTTGSYFGSSVSVTGGMWDLSGPMDCGQIIEDCNNGVDDDDDGLVDCNDPDCIGEGNADVVFSSSGVDNPQEALDIPDGVPALFYDGGDQFILDLTDIIPLSEKYTLTWRKRITTGPKPSVLVEESTDGITYAIATGAPFTLNTSTYFETEITASVDTRYLRITSQNNADMDFDAVGYNLRCATFCPTATINPHVLYSRPIKGK